MNAKELAEAKAQHKHYGQLVIQMLDDLHSLYERRYFGEYNVVTDLIDLNRAIQLAELTPKQAEVLRYVTEGYEQKEIASIMGISVPTAHEHYHVTIRKIAVIYETWEELDNE